MIGLKAVKVGRFYPSLLPQCSLELLRDVKAKPIIFPKLKRIENVQNGKKSMKEK